MKLNKIMLIALLLAIFSLTPVFSAERVEKLVILGAGPAGLTSAIYAGQANLAPLVIEGNNNNSQLANVYQMENFPGFPQGVTGKELLGRMYLQAEKFGALFYQGILVDVDLSSRPFRLTLSDGEIIYSEALIIASGSSKRWLGLDSEEALKGKGVACSATLEAPQFRDKDVAVIGAGDAALEEALVLTKYARKVTLVCRSNKFSASPYLQEKIFSDVKIQIIWNSAVDEILDVLQERVTAIALRDLKSGERSILPCEGVFVSIGSQPSTALFQGQLEIKSSGFIVVDSPGAATTIPGVFAAGDVSDPRYRKAITAAAAGCIAAIDAIRFLEIQAES